jgi:hypothetical protein
MQASPEGRLTLIPERLSRHCHMTVAGRALHPLPKPCNGAFNCLLLLIFLSRSRSRRTVTEPVTNASQNG